MTDSDTFECSSCGARYKRGGLPGGKKVRCRKCEAVITLPADEAPDLETFDELEDILGPSDPPSPKPAPARKPAPAPARKPAPAPTRKPAPAPTPARAAAARATAPSAASRRPEPRPARAARSGTRRAVQEPKSKAGLWIGVGVVVVAIAVIAIVMSGGQSEANTQPHEPKQPPVAARTPRENFDAHLADAETAADPAKKKSHLHAAAALLDYHGWKDAGTSLADLYNRVIEIDADDAEARKALDFHRYPGPFEKYKGKWVKKSELAKIGREYLEHKKAEAEKVAAEAERLRWTKDAFAKSCARVRDAYRKDIAKVPDMKLRFFFDIPEIPRPYFLMVQDVVTPDPEETAKQLGPGLAALRTAFATGYRERNVFAEWDDEKHVVPIMIFKDTASYEKYRDNGHPYFPPTGLAAAFYVSRATEGLDGIARGVLYVWQGASEHRFNHEVFHEGTHQLMHNASATGEMAGTPWVQEGIAEFWGSYKGNRYQGYEFKQVLHSRKGSIQSAARNFYQDREGGGFMTPKDLIEYTGNVFQRDKAILASKGGTPQQRAVAGFRVGSVYALGWAFIYWSNTQEGGKYREAWLNTLRDELNHEYDPEKVAKYFGIESDDDWEALNKKFFLFCARKLRKLK